MKLITLLIWILPTEPVRGNALRKRGKYTITTKSVFRSHCIVLSSIFCLLLVNPPSIVKGRERGHVFAVQRAASAVTEVHRRRGSRERRRRGS